MEWISKNWLTILPFVGAAAAWAVATVIQALTLHRQQDQREWQRIQELIKIIGNEGGKIGTWEQIAAVMELRAMKNKKKFVKPLIAKLRPLYEGRDASKELLAELDELLNEQ